ncbi:MULTISPECIES: glycerol-3-phosphate responsive antiterminator [Bacillaceae]|uniref:glycerol-3-phosphate responsive antiterminator n=1 Tax=Bacillaceae TaxID=186817 RepID=UPI000BFE9429|nr:MULTISPECIES: glycerol-3-phosphate responsive antiterminator [Bacillaceae]PGT82255.1 transcriptional regulator [Bacillus sp. AFS040349]UGB31401.1 glycerol-3-phosphate responsive antiterminator [Metabacillus sp. B2-18]
MDMLQEFAKRLKEDQVIASIKDPKSLDQFLNTNIQSAFLLTGNISVIKRYVDLLKKNNRFVFLHIEKIPGISYDREGLKFIAKYVKPTGIITTKSSLIQLAKKEGLLTIQRLFLVDTDAVKNGLQTVNDIQPDALEIMPALIPDMISKLRRETNLPIITGGLIQNQLQIEAALESGAVAVSTGRPWLWKTCKEEKHRI